MFRGIDLIRVTMANYYLHVLVYMELVLSVGMFRRPYFLTAREKNILKLRSSWKLVVYLPYAL